MTAFPAVLARAKRALLSVGFIAFDALARAFASGKGGGVLVVRVDAIGDFFLWLDSVRALREIYPRPIRLTLAVHPPCAPFARELGIFDEVIEADAKAFRRKPAYRARLIRDIASRGFSTAIHPTYSRDFHCGDALVLASRAAERIGFDGDSANLTPWEKRFSRTWYTRLVAGAPGTRMELIRNAEFVRALGAGGFKASLAELPIRPARPDGLPGSYYALFPGASWIGKCWPPEAFAALADRLHAETGLAGVLCGGPGDAAAARAVAAAAAAPLVDLAGKTTLLELAAVLRHSSLLVSNDSGAVHIAATLGVPSVCIVGGGHFGRFLPYVLEKPPATDVRPVVANRPMDCYGCNWSCIHPREDGRPVRCIREVEVEEVFSKARSILAGRAASTGKRI